MKNITVCVLGGLGNQLHCYAFGRAIAYRNKAKLELDTESCYWNDYYGRTFLLHLFPHISLKCKVLPQTWVAQLIFKVIMKFGIALSDRLPLALKLVVCEELPRRYQAEVHQTLFRFKPYFRGYWASFRYYDQVGDALHKELVPPKPDNLIAVKMLENIKSGLSCSIHYRTYQEEVGVFHPSLSEYYRSAIEFMNNKHPGIKYFVFSDELDVAREELDFLRNNLTYVDINGLGGNEESLIDFYLMYACDHSIIGDSTFSWWAAWLSDHSLKTIIAPGGLSPWGNDWCPPHWVSIQVF